MKFRRAIFIVVYSKKKKPEYLILKRKRHWVGWEFPKGGRKRFESVKKTIQREIKEETGLEIIKGRLKNHHVTGSFLYKNKKRDSLKHDGQKYRLFSVEIRKKKVNLKNNPDNEHSDFKWLDFEKALKKLTWGDQRKCLRGVNNWLENEN